MNLLSGLINGMREIWAHKVRSLLSMIGIIMGVASLVSMVGVIEGMISGMWARFEASGGIEKIEIDDKQPPEEQQHIADLSPGRTMEDAEAILRAVPLVAAVSAEYNARWKGAWAPGGRGTGIRVRGVTSGAETVENVQVEHGRFISDLDVKQRLPVIVLGSRAYEAGFRRAKQAIGKTIYIAGEPFVVVGTTKHLENSSGGRNTLRWFNAYVYVPITTAMDLWGGENPQITDLSVRIDSAREMDAALALIDNTLRQTHRGIEDYEFDTNAEQLEELKALERSFTLSLGSLAAISLLVGGIGIMNVMLASVNERIREIGVRKALGARAGDVFIQFIAEAFVISTIGGLLGLAASLGMLDILQDILPDGGEIPSAPLGAMAVAFLFSVSMGVVSGIYPALRAARLSPIDALRHE